jgi:hypothetical protein
MRGSNAAQSKGLPLILVGLCEYWIASRCPIFCVILGLGPRIHLSTHSDVAVADGPARTRRRQRDGFSGQAHACPVQRVLAEDVRRPFHFRPLPPCGGGSGWGVRPAFRVCGVTPTPALPPRGGGREDCETGGKHHTVVRPSVSDPTVKLSNRRRSKTMLPTKT